MKGTVHGPGSLNDGSQQPKNTFPSLPVSCLTKGNRSPPFLEFLIPYPSWLLPAKARGKNKRKEKKSSFEATVIKALRGWWVTLTTGENRLAMWTERQGRSTENQTERLIIKIHNNQNENPLAEIIRRWHSAEMWSQISELRYKLLEILEIEKNGGILKNYRKYPKPRTSTEGVDARNRSTRRQNRKHIPQ